MVAAAAATFISTFYYPPPPRTLSYPPFPSSSVARRSLALNPTRLAATPLSIAAAAAAVTEAPERPERAVRCKVDRSGRFCIPRAARELALLVSYAACLEGLDPVRLFDHRVNERTELGFTFDKTALLAYNHMSFAGAPVEVESEEEAKELTRQDERESANAAYVLSAPPKLVYNKHVLRFARDLLVAVIGGWDERVAIINKIVPRPWRVEPAARIIELCILHLAMAEITSVGTPHQIVINEAIDLAKRFCDGAAPRTLNGCLRTFVTERDKMQR